MKRPVLFAILAGVGVMAVALIGLVRVRPKPDYRLLRAKALVHTENYLQALAVLRSVPPGVETQAETHSYLGAAYLNLHLYQAAISEFQEAARLNPRALDPWLGLASTYIRIGNGPKALEEAGKAAAIGNDATDAWLMLGRANWLQRNFAEAEKAALKAQSLDPQNTLASELLLHVYFDGNDESKFQQLLERIPDASPAVRGLAVRFFLRRGEFRRAFELRNRWEKRVLDKQIVENQLDVLREPARMDIYPVLVRNLVRAGRFNEAVRIAQAYRGPAVLDLELGKAYASIGDKDSALVSYRRASAARTHKLSAEIALAALTRDPRHWSEAFRAERIEQDYFILAQLQDVLGSATDLEKSFIFRYAGVYDPFLYNKAAEHALSVLNVQPEAYDALMSIATAYHRLGRIDDAQRYIDIARNTYPQRAEPWSRLAALKLARRDIQAAIVDMQRAVNLEPSNPTYLYNLGWAFDQIGKTRDAVIYYERAIAASPLSFEAMNNLALIDTSAGRSDSALRFLLRATEADPEHEAAYFNLANYYVGRRSWREALDTYRRILEINDGNSTARVEIGRVLVEIGRIDQAVEQLNQALDIDPHSVEAYLVLATAYEKTGHTKEAFAALEEARRISPEAPEIKSSMDRLKEK